MLFALFDFNVNNNINPINHDSIAAISCSSILCHPHLEPIFIYLRHLTTFFLTTLCIRLRSTEPESKTSLSIRSSHSCSKNCIPTSLIYLYPPIFPGSPFAFILIPHSIARASHIVFYFDIFPLHPYHFPPIPIPLSISQLHFASHIESGLSSPFSVFLSCCAPASAAPLHISNS